MCEVEHLVEGVESNGPVANCSTKEIALGHIRCHSGVYFRCGRGEATWELTVGDWEGYWSLRDNTMPDLVKVRVR